MSRTYLRGDLYYADLGHGIGSEQKGNRPNEAHIQGINHALAISIDLIVPPSPLN